MRKALASVLVILSLLAFPVFSSGVDTYCFDLLTETEQLAYQALHDCLIHLITSWNCGSMSPETIQKAFDCLLMDHPEIYWVNGYTYVTSYLRNSITGHRVEFTYNLDRQTILDTNQAIEQSIMDIAGQLDSIDQSYETVKAVYDYMIGNCSYDELNLDQSLCSVMLDRSGVCASFSKAFEFMMQCLGIPCTVVYGRLTQSEGMLNTTLGHEWNIVQINGQWYHVDVTSGIALTKESGIPDYRFLCTTTSDILRTHTIENPVPIPECNATDLEFYTYHGLSVETYSREAVATCMLRAMDLGYGPVVRFMNYHAFSDAIEDLFTNEGIFKAIEEATGQVVSSVDYTIDEEELILRLYD
ncbi:MAG: hypothetical protein IJ863_01280 [Spirochaetales bacterium]|nr:hypothetical protein [Spirochaetales bacterium]